jgi:hypothetical protein
MLVLRRLAQLAAVLAVTGCDGVRTPTHAPAPASSSAPTSVAAPGQPPPVEPMPVAKAGQDASEPEPVAPPKAELNATPPKQEAKDPAEPKTPQTLAANILEFAQATVAGDAWKELGEYSYLNTTLQAVQRHARDVVNPDGHDPAYVSARSAALLNALQDAASTAEGIALRPRTSAANKQALAQLQAQLREHAATLGGVILPLPAVTSINVSTPERRLAVTALELVQTTSADASFLAPGRHPTLSAGIETLERAAQSILAGDDADQGVANAKLSALSTAIQTTVRVAEGIDRRANENPENRKKAAELATSLRTVAAQLGMVKRSPPPPTRLQ